MTARARDALALPLAMVDEAIAEATATIRAC